MPPRGSAVLLTEPLEDVREKRWIDAGARIGDADRQAMVLPRELDSNLSALRRELDRVREQIPDDLLHARRIAPQSGLGLARVDLDRNVLRVRRVADGVERAVDERSNGDHLAVEAQLAGNDTRDVQQI